MAATGAAMGLSRGQLIPLLAIGLPNGTVPSRATGGRWVSQASRQAGDLLALLAQRCQRWVRVLCLDAIVFHREPILMGGEPPSRAWVAGQRGPERSGASWSARIATWPCVEHGIAAAGTGLARGVTLANEARAAAAHAPAGARPIQMGLEVLRTQREIQCVVHGP